MLYHEFEQRLLNRLQPSQPVYVAYSGGMDSHVVLHLLARFAASHRGRRYAAVHIHHGLSDNADHWLEHCAAICKTMGIDFFSQHLTLSQQKRQSLEAQARAARYQALAKVIPAGAMVLLGQHQQDQLETVLLQLKRGAGPKGLSAMAELSERDGLHYLRPLLECTRQQLSEYARQHGLQWIEDESNQDLGFDRNFLRHQIIPLLEQRWPGIQKAVARSATLFAEQQHLLDQQSQISLEQVRAEDNTLSLAALSKLSSAWRSQLIRTWLSEQGAPMPPQTVISRLQQELIEARADASPCISWGAWQFRRFDQRLYLLKVQSAAPAETLIWRGETELNLHNGCCLYLQQGEHPPDQGDWLGIRLDGTVSIEFGGWSERFRPSGAGVSKPLKQWFKLWKIPPWQRAELPLLRSQDRLVAVPGYAVAEDCQPQRGSKSTLWVRMA
jgi:tRNA(Ile)-lysidine synthase